MEKLFPYQEVGAKWLATKPRALLADEMGLGKSAQAITACDIVGAKRILVLCPAIGRSNWIAEFQKFSRAGLSLSAVYTTVDRPSFVSGIVCSYNLMTNDSVYTWISSHYWDVVVLDESHFLKNRKANRTEAVFGPLTEKSRFVWALSGTPAPNHGGELYPLLRAFRAYNQDYWTYARRYCVLLDTQYETRIVGTKRIPEIRALLAPFTLRRTKKEVMPELPPIVYSDYAVEPGEVDLIRWHPEVETHFRTIEEIEKRIVDQQAAVDTVVNVTGLGKDGLQSLKGLQAKCMESRRYTGLQKVPAVAELIASEMDAGAYDKKVIFCIHKAVVEELRERLRKFDPVVVFGETPAKKREKRIKRFEKNKRCRLFIANIQAAGTMINLTCASHVDIVEPSWVPSDNAQAIMRLHRYGQINTVFARFFLLPNSSDQKVVKVLKRKTAELTEIFDPSDAAAEVGGYPTPVDPFEGA